MPRASGEKPPELTVGWASLEATRIACLRWHYAAIMPTGKLVQVGAWEDGVYVGAVVFSRGASPYLGKRWDLDHTELCELTRVALREHRTPVSQIVARGLRMLKATNPGLRLVISFADPKEGHRGGIYQAGNWIYTGESGRTIECFVRGRWRHVRGSYHELRDSGLLEEFREARHAMHEGAPSGIYATMQAMGRMRITPGKHRYVYPLDRQMRRRAEKLREDYPRAATPTEGPEASSLGGRFDPELAASQVGLDT